MVFWKSLYNIKKNLKENVEIFLENVGIIIGENLG